VLAPPGFFSRKAAKTRPRFAPLQEFESHPQEKSFPPVIPGHSEFAGLRGGSRAPTAPLQSWETGVPPPSPALAKGFQRSRRDSGGHSPAIPDECSQFGKTSRPFWSVTFFVYRVSCKFLGPPTWAKPGPGPRAPPRNFRNQSAVGASTRAFGPLAPTAPPLELRPLPGSNVGTWPGGN